MTKRWIADPNATFTRRIGRSAAELGNTSQGKTCPDIWELSNGDIAVVGTDMTEVFAGRLPDDVSIGMHERLVVIPRNMAVAAKPELPDA
ncbi:hypothetical protein NDW01_03790 [Actinoallomurus sp. WRP6H-15]|nr:hypothetical protein [Actinoallomurus soli]